MCSWHYGLEYLINSSKSLTRSLETPCSFVWSRVLLDIKSGQEVLKNFKVCFPCWTLDFKNFERIGWQFGPLDCNYTHVLLALWIIMPKNVQKINALCDKHSQISHLLASSIALKEYKGCKYDFFLQELHDNLDRCLQDCNDTLVFMD